MFNINVIRKLAAKSNHQYHKHAAIVVSGGAVIAQGYNLDTCHAEVQALKKIWPNKRKGCTVYSYRIRRDGAVGMAKPCPDCEAYMRSNGIKQVFYSDNDGVIQKEKY